MRPLIFYTLVFWHLCAPVTLGQKTIGLDPESVAKSDSLQIYQYIDKLSHAEGFEKEDGHSGERYHFGSVYYAPDSSFKIFVIEGEVCGMYCNPIWISFTHFPGPDGEIVEGENSINFEGNLKIYALRNDQYLVLTESHGRIASPISITSLDALLLKKQGAKLLKEDFSFSFYQEHFFEHSPVLEFDEQSGRLSYRYYRYFGYGGSMTIDSDSLFYGHFTYHSNTFTHSQAESYYIEVDENKRWQTGDTSTINQDSIRIETYIESLNTIAKEQNLVPKYYPVYYDFGSVHYAPDSSFKIFVVGSSEYSGDNPSMWMSYIHMPDPEGFVEYPYYFYMKDGFEPIDTIYSLANGQYISIEKISFIDSTTRLLRTRIQGYILGQSGGKIHKNDHCAYIEHDHYFDSEPLLEFDPDSAEFTYQYYQHYRSGDNADTVSNIKGRYTLKEYVMGQLHEERSFIVVEKGQGK